MAVASGVVTGMEQQSWGCGAGAQGRGGVWVLGSDLGAVLTTSLVAVWPQAGV